MVLRRSTASSRSVECPPITAMNQQLQFFAARSQLSAECEIAGHLIAATLGHEDEREHDGVRGAWIEAGGYQSSGIEGARR